MQHAGPSAVQQEPLQCGTPALTCWRRGRCRLALGPHLPLPPRRQAGDSAGDQAGFTDARHCEDACISSTEAGWHASSTPFGLSATLNEGARRVHVRRTGVVLEQRGAWLERMHPAGHDRLRPWRQNFSGDGAGKCFWSPVPRVQIRGCTTSTWTWHGIRTALYNDEQACKAAILFRFACTLLEPAQGTCWLFVWPKLRWRSLVSLQEPSRWPVLATHEARRGLAHEPRHHHGYGKAEGGSPGSTKDSARIAQAEQVTDLFVKVC